jgi:hypothetical protein
VLLYELQVPEQLRLNQVHLTIVRKFGGALRQIAVLHERSGMSVALDAVILDKLHAQFRHLAEAVTDVAAYRNDCPGKFSRILINPVALSSCPYWQRLVGLKRTAPELAPHLSHPKPNVDGLAGSRHGCLARTTGRPRHILELADQRRREARS